MTTAANKTRADALDAAIADTMAELHKLQRERKALDLDPKPGEVWGVSTTRVLILKPHEGKFGLAWSTGTVHFYSTMDEVCLYLVRNGYTKTQDYCDFT